MMATTSVALKPMDGMSHGRKIGRGHPTISKRMADYQENSSNGRRCVVCCMFVPGRPGHCTMIKGVISPSGYCKYWQSGPNDTCS